MTQQSGRRFISQENAAGGELITVLTSIQPRSMPAIGKHRKQTWTASSQLDMAQTRQTPIPPVLWCQTSWAIQILDSVATQTRAHHDNLHSWWWQREQYHLGLIQSPLKGTICAQMWFTRDLSCWRVCWQCFSFSLDCVSVCVYDRQQRPWLCPVYSAICRSICRADVNLQTNNTAL